MSHFSSTRMLQAQRVKLNNVKNKPALVSSTGKGRVNFRLINKRVYKPKQEKPVASIKYVTITGVVIGSNFKLRDDNDFWGSNVNPPFSFIHVYNVAVGDIIKYIDPNDNTEKTTTVASIEMGALRAKTIYTADDHGISVDDYTTITIEDKS